MAVVVHLLVSLPVGIGQDLILYKAWRDFLEYSRSLQLHSEEAGVGSQAHVCMVPIKAFGYRLTRPWFDW